MATLKTIYTIGYEGKTIEEFIEALKKSKISLLIDARARANSRKTDFAKNKLKTILEQNDIVYQHHKKLGTPKYLMDVMRTKGHYSMDEYASYLDSHDDILDEFLSEIDGASEIVLMCYEKSPTDCHRSVVADRLSKKLKASIIHL